MKPRKAFPRLTPDKGASKPPSQRFDEAMSALLSVNKKRILEIEEQEKEKKDPDKR
jgi:hypothetical protein